ncbi:hypothetical protein TNCV_3697621 [Trichonephila clavipes]|uniref:Uncharacterized protein n=1 Tax=Trichonephila clavipes TaxID=2585209 RepID=A0A8X6VKU4_TRICX|nr:hypothetical protein TNCV_3697621 [Trichonephila clavipes]
MRVQNFIQKVQYMRQIENRSKPLMQMVYEGCLRAGANIRPSAELAERLSLHERISTPSVPIPAEPESTPFAEPESIPPAQPERMPPAERPPLDMMNPSVFVNTVKGDSAHSYSTPDNSL